MSNRVTFFLARLVLGFVFVYASFDKILHPDAFAKLIHNYQLLPDSAINLAAIVLPWLELILGFMLLFGIWLHGAVALTALLLFLFSSALIISTARGLDIHCGCFTTNPEGKPELIWTIIRDFVFLFLAGYLILETYFSRFSRTNAGGGVQAQDYGVTKGSNPNGGFWMPALPNSGKATRQGMLTEHM